MTEPSASTEGEMFNAVASGRGPSAARERPVAFGVGDVIGGRYELRRDLGRGAAGVVFEAEHKFTQRRVAIKIVHPDAPWASVGELRARLIREARALAAVRHPGIVDILDGGIAEDGTPYIVLEMLEGGRTLEGLLATREKISLSDTVGLTLQLCDALTAAHDANVVHRDLKPGNIILMRDRYGFEHVKLVDFGTAQMRRPREQKLTGIGALIGTPEYMAPEQLLAFDDVDHRADVYAIGITMFECLSGRVPYVGSYPQVLLQASSSDPPPSLLVHCPDAGPALVAVIDRAISKDREHRYPTVAALAQALNGAVPGARKATTLLGPPPAPPALPEPPKPTPAEQAAQRRRAARAAYATPINIVLASGQVIEGRSEDISEGGLLVICRGDCKPQQRATVRFALPMEGTIVTCTTELRWVRLARPSDPAGPRALGLEFVDPPPELKASIAQYVQLMTR